MDAMPHTQLSTIDLEELFSAGPIVLMVRKADPGWTVTYLSDSIFDLLGYRPEEIISRGFGFIELIHPEDVERAIRETRDHLAAKRPRYETAYRLRTRAGGHVWVRDVSRPVYADSGETLHIQGCLLDQAETRAAKTALKDSEARFRDLAEVAGEYIWEVDTQGRYTFLSEPFKVLMGVPMEQALGKTPFDFMPDEEAEVVRQRFFELARAMQPFRGLEHSSRRADGRLVWQKVSGLPMIGEEGELLGYRGMARDITERKLMERMKDEFVSTVSHELRTPLTTIKGAVGLLAGGALGQFSGEARKMLDLAYQNSQRLADLIDDLLDMDKIAAGKMQFNMHELELMPLVEKTLEMNAASAARHGVVFSLGERVDGARVRVDEQRLHQVLANYLSNAAKFSPRGNEVRLAVTRQGDMIRVAVQDKGPGIPRDFQERIFQSFTQADSSDTRQKGGTGLGLAIAKALAEKMNGQVGFFSKEGQGATFYVDLPLVDT